MQKHFTTQSFCRITYWHRFHIDDLADIFNNNDLHKELGFEDHTGTLYLGRWAIVENKKTQERSYTGAWAIVEIKTYAVEHSGTPRGVAKRSQTLITNGVTCWVRPTRRWFYQAFNFDFSLGIRTVVILAWCPRHHTMMWGAAALETGRTTVHHVTANTSAGCG